MNSQYISTLTNKPQMVPADAPDPYKRPMPLDMINKFVGLDSRILHHDDVVQKQAFDQSYKNFWSFVDFNIIYGEDNPVDLNTCKHTHTAPVKPAASMTKGAPCSGITMTYQEARELANKL
ncbi:MAG: hypothetical protein MJ252_00700 [archaeon]|nr:hypothetical protein [archaeon]